MIYRAIKILLYFINLVYIYEMKIYEVLLYLFENIETIP